MKLNTIIDPDTKSKFYKKKNNLISKNGKIYRIIKNIPRFVKGDNYAKNFGFQWKKFSKTQLDSHTGLIISEKRVRKIFKKKLIKLKDKKILEAGSGSGRFTEIFLKYGGLVDSFDYSNAVEANYKNNKNKNLTLVQADIRNIPFKNNYYDYVFCLGVLQHTPNTEESINSLWIMLKPGGELFIDHYIFKWRTYLPPPIGQALNIYRFVILFLPHSVRFKLVKFFVDLWFPIHWKFKNFIFIQKILRRISPVIFYYGRLKLNNKQMYYKWSLLDTYDSTTDTFKNKITKTEILKILKKLSAKKIKISYGDNGIEVSCKK
jgi:ubiquinone/menaquinone biosynthesis C-methylase UbiE